MLALSETFATSAVLTVEALKRFYAVAVSFFFFLLSILSIMRVNAQPASTPPTIPSASNPPEKVEPAAVNCLTVEVSFLKYTYVPSLGSLKQTALPVRLNTLFSPKVSVALGSVAVTCF